VPAGPYDHLMGLRERFDLVRSRDLTLGTLLERFAAVYGTTRLVEEAGDGLSLTHLEADDLVARLATGIGEQIARGDRVVVATPNGYMLLLLALAVGRAGGVAVPVNPQMSRDEIDHVIADSEATLVIGDPAEVERSHPTPAADVDPNEVAVLFYTSGTTGRPKGAQLTHASLVGAAGAGAAALPLGWMRHECVTGMPVAHVAGFSLLIQMAALGIPVHLLTKFRPDEALDAIEARRATIFMGVPAMYRMMLEAGAEQRDLSSVRVWVSGADVMPPDLARRYQRMGAIGTVPVLGRPLGLAAFVDGYGMVELGGGVAVRVHLPGMPLPGDGVVRPMRGHKLRVVDESGAEVQHGEIGELVVRGPGMMRGYHGKADESREAFDREGWLRTGDLARRRRFGVVEFAGRSKDVVKHGGYSVFAVEVENVLRDHPDVVDAALVGLPDEQKGEIPAAVVQRAAGSSLGAEELGAWAREHLSTYKVPRRITFVDELPRTGTHKVRKGELRRLFDR
jgi:acyl-CoA synthetase (AMP-forming)/AMP-acid ligase II